MTRFSVIIPAYNAEDRIRKVLESIKIQEFTDYELIVVCDSCTDNTEKIAREEYGAITSEETFHNDGLSRSTGLDMASGDYILFLDDDDWWISDDILTMLDKVIDSSSPVIDIFQFGFIWKVIAFFILIFSSSDIILFCFKHTVIIKSSLTTIKPKGIVVRISSLFSFISLSLLLLLLITIKSFPTASKMPLNTLSRHSIESENDT